MSDLAIAGGKMLEALDFGNKKPNEGETLPDFSEFTSAIAARFKDLADIGIDTHLPTGQIDLAELQALEEMQSFDRVRGGFL